MANWKTARQIAEQYRVGEERLLAYSRRGNLACRRRDDGTTEFDEDAVARIFRRRGGSSPIAVLSGQGPNLGVLGVTRLGSAADREPIAGHRASRRLSIRLTTPQEAARKLAS